MSVASFFLKLLLVSLLSVISSFQQHRHGCSSSSIDAFTTTSCDASIDAIRRDDFPILSVEAYPGKPLVYLDSAASSHKPKSVLESMDNYYLTSHSNVHRGAHALATRATEMYEAARCSVQRLVNAKSRDEIVFTKGATDAINIVASSIGRGLNAGDEIILSVMEHHSNLVPWQMVAQSTGAVLKFVQITPSMQFDLDHYKRLD